MSKKNPKWLTEFEKDCKEIEKDCKDLGKLVDACSLEDIEYLKKNKRFISNMRKIEKLVEEARSMRLDFFKKRKNK